MMSPTLHSIVVSIIMLILLCRYFIKNFGTYPALIKYDNKGNVPSYMKDSLQKHFKGGAAFKRCLIALIFTTPFFIGTAFIIYLSADYLEYTDSKMNSWALVRDAYDVSIKNDPEFMYNLEIVSLLIIGAMLILASFFATCKSISIRKEAKEKMR